MRTPLLMEFSQAQWLNLKRPQGYSVFKNQQPFRLEPMPIVH